MLQNPTLSRCFMNANTAKFCGAFLVLNTLWHSRSAFNNLYLQPAIFSQFSANGLFHFIPVPSTDLIFQLVVGVYYLAGIVFLFSFQRYALLVFFLTGSVVDNIQVNFLEGGHSRYLQYAALLYTTLALFIKTEARPYLNGYRALVAAYYFTAGLYKFSVSGFFWALDNSIYVHAVAVQVTTPMKEFILQNTPILFKIGAYIVYWAELLAPLILFWRPARWTLLSVLFLFHLTFPVIWGGHGDFVVNCLCLALCLADEPFAKTLFNKYQCMRDFVLKYFLQIKEKLNV